VKRFTPAPFDQTKFFREIDTLTGLKHPCILQIRGWMLPEGRQPAEIRTCLAENGSLSDVLEKVRCGTRLPFWNATGKGILICGIALALRFIHSKRIIHGDLKPSNILVSARGEALLSDFGASRCESNDSPLTIDGGTVNYAAPELFKDGAVHTSRVDVFAFGLVLYEILTEQAVFPRSEYAFPIGTRISHGELPAVPEECGPVMQALIPRCWSMNPEKRPTFDEIIREFKAENFRIVPGADVVRVAAYVEDIERWEAEDAVQSQSK
jgi:serine/threonine protein kinase